MKIIEIIYKGEKPFHRKVAKLLRGYIANKFVEIIEFHNHLDEISFNYRSPKIQYRVIKGNLSIIGINECGDLLLKYIDKIDINDINLTGIETKIIEKELSIKFSNIEFTENFQEYIFDSFWFALNDENRYKYKQKKFDLNVQLANNILEFFKLCGITAEKRIFAEGNFQEYKVMEKNTEMLVFTGTFKTNVKLPEYIGLGKRKSVGYGLIKKIK